MIIRSTPRKFEWTGKACTVTGGKRVGVGKRSVSVGIRVGRGNGVAVGIATVGVLTVLVGRTVGFGTTAAGKAQPGSRSERHRRMIRDALGTRFFPGRNVGMDLRAAG